MLRTRLMLGLVCMLLILLLMGVYSINQCSQLGRRIEAASRSGDPVSRSIQQMKRNAAAMNNALLSLITADQVKSMRDFDAASLQFAEALQKENAEKCDCPDMVGLSHKISDLFSKYDTQARTFLKEPYQADQPGRATANNLGTDSAKILDLLDQLSFAHEQILTTGSKSMAADINRTIDFLVLLMIIALAAFLSAYVGLSRGLLNPLRSLTSSIKQVGEGNLEQEVPVMSKDELGILAVSFNQMASQLRQYRVDASDELERLNMTIRVTLASFPDPIFVLNSAGAVEFRNPAGDRLAVKLLFSGVMRLPGEVEEKVEQVRASGEDYLPTLFKDAIKFHLDGQDRYFLPRIVLLRDDKKEIFGVAVILEDVTRMLLLDDVKSNLISTVSHELKTPLTSVRMVIYLLHEKNVGPLNDRQADLVATAREDADRLLRTLNDLLDLAKLEGGVSPLQLRLTSPSQLVATAERAAKEVANAADVALKTDVALDLPEIKVDQQRLAYVFANLINNAIKYSPAGTRILVRAQPGQTRANYPSIRFSVLDQGPGIGSEHIGHLFERFYRVPGTNKTGAGLGLSIAHEIVVAHQGEMGVISKVGEGSEFFFVLPLPSTLRPMHT